MLYLIAIVLALGPALGWIYIFNKQNPETRKAIFLTFVAGMLSTAIILVYKYFWDEAVNLIFFEVKAVSFKESIMNIFEYETMGLLTKAASEGIFKAILGTFFIFIGVGALEEYAKHWVVKTFDHSFFRSIDDVIELSIVAALGFAFVENVLYFVNHWHDLSSAQLAFFVFFRVTIVTMVHVLCSGVFGYYYGLAYFAGPVLKDEEREGRKLFFTKTFHKIFHLKSETIFRDEKILEGLIISIGLHAVYDFVLQLNLTFASIFSWIGLNIPINIPLHVIIMPLYLIGGYFYLMYLLQKKEDHKKFGKLVLREEYVAE
jgi:RsiW-degrading membrane proteinase PrsW (M82 family)